MNRRTSVLATTIASVIWGATALAQSDVTQSDGTQSDGTQSDGATPPTSTSQDMQESSSSYETAPAQTGSATSSSDATAGTSDEATLGAGVATPVDQAKVEKFADAYVQVQTIQQKANADLQTATDPAAADQVKSSAQTDMIAAVERSGLQIEEFNEIVASMAADTELRSRVSAEVQKRVGATTGPAGGAEAGTR